MSDSSQWFDHQIVDLSPPQRAALEQSLRAEGIPATFGPAAVRTDVAYEARVSTLIDQARAVGYAAPPPGYPAAGYPPGGNPPGGYGAAGASTPTNSNSIVALVLGIGSLLFCQLVGPAAVIVGQRARREITRTGEQGDGMALAGVITGAIATGLLVIGVVAIIVIFVIALASSS